MDHVTATAYPRVGLLGNPSDAYGGRVIAFTFRDFAASVRTASSDRLRLAGPAGVREFVHHLELAGGLRECADGVQLLGAALIEFVGWCEQHRPAALGPSRAPAVDLRFATDIPRQVGLAGSSAIVIAALRALVRHFQVTIPPFELAALALRAETERLGIAAGPQDRVVQTYEGLIDMDFAPPVSEASYRRLDPACLPALFLAWERRSHKSSGTAHDDVRQRYARGDPPVRRAMARFAEIAEEGARCLREGDVARLATLMNENFDTRATIWRLRPQDHEMVALGRRRGAGVKFCGSGGAVVGVMPDAAAWTEIEAAYRAAGYATLRPHVDPKAEAPPA